MTEPKEAAVVTREHRERAYRCIWLDEPRSNERRWIETGDDFNLPVRLKSTAQAIADAETSGRAAVVYPTEAYNLGRASRDSEVERLKRLLRGVVAPCRQCGDSIEKCAGSMCCMGCDHANGDRK